MKEYSTKQRFLAAVLSIAMLCSASPNVASLASIRAAAEEPPITAQDGTPSQDGDQAQPKDNDAQPQADGEPQADGAPEADGTPQADGAPEADGTLQADGTPQADGDTPTTLADSPNVASVNGVPYTYLQEALIDAAIEGNATVTLLANVSISSTLVIGDAITLDLAGFGIDAGGECGVFLLTGSNDALTLIDSNPSKANTVNGTAITGGYITGGKAQKGGAFYAEDGASITMQGGTIVGNVAVKTGGGVHLQNASFTMQGGAITGNTTTDTYGMGGGVYLQSTGSSNASFTLQGGTVLGNSAQVAGGGIYATKAQVDTGTTTLTIAGGSVSGNRLVASNTSGGGIFASSVLFNMTGGEVRDNTSKATYYAEGGGLYLAYSTKATITGGTITGNTATGQKEAVGGIYLQRWADLTLGAQSEEDNSMLRIADNQAGATADALAASNLYLDGDKKINVASDISGRGTIGITTQNPRDGLAFTNEGAAASGVFRTDDPAYMAQEVKSGGSYTYQLAKMTASVAYQGNVTGYTSLEDAFTAASEMPGTDPVSITLHKHVTTTDSIETFRGKAITLDLNGFGITYDSSNDAQNGTNPVVYVGMDAHFTLKDSNPSARNTVAGNIVWGGYLAGGTGAQMPDGTYGGGVLVEGGFGAAPSATTFTMQGGTICANAITSEGGNAYGGGIATIQSVTVVLQGGTIAGNKATSSSGKAYGGVYIAKGSGHNSVLQLQSGSAITIQENTATAGQRSGDSNLYLPGGVLAEVVSTPASGSHIKVSYGSADGTGVFTTPGTECTAFASDDAGLTVQQNNTDDGVTYSLAQVVASTQIGGGPKTYYTSIEAAVAAANAADSTPESPALITLLRDVTISDELVVRGSAFGDAVYVTLDLNNHSITYLPSGGGDNPVINANGCNVFTLMDSSAQDPSTQTVHYAYFDAAAFIYRITDDATLAQANDADYLTFAGGYLAGGNNGGVSAASSTITEIKATFHMKGGTIVGNTTSSGGGGVSLNGTMYMEGGSIIGNTASVGGGVNAYGDFTMLGGSIAHNRARTNGGGVRVSTTDKICSFTFGGGTIADNVAAQGDALYLYGKKHSVSMNADATLVGTTYLGAGQSIALLGALSGSLVLHPASTASVGNPVTLLTAGEGYTLTKADMAKVALADPTVAGGIALHDQTIELAIYKATFSAGEGTFAPDATTSQTADAGKAITLPAADVVSFSGYTFAGWSCDGGVTLLEAGASVVPDGDTTYTAIWALAPPAWVNIEPMESGAEDYDDGVVTYGEALTLVAMHRNEGGLVNYTYAWYQDGVLLPEQTKDFIVLKNVAESGSYTATVTANREGFVSASKTSAPQAAAVLPAVLDVVLADGLTLRKEYDGTTTLPALATVGGLVVQGMQYDETATAQGTWGYHSPDAGATVAVDISDISISYAASVQAGNYTYAGASLATVGEITPLAVGSTAATPASIAPIPTQPYTGEAITPQPAVTRTVQDQNGKEQTITLTLGKDYTLAYANNINESDSDALNAPTVTVNFMGNYAGSLSQTFRIEIANVLVGQNGKVVAVGNLINGVVTKLMATDGTPYTPTKGVYIIVVYSGESSQARAAVIAADGDPLTAALPTIPNRMHVAVMTDDTNAAADGFTEGMLTAEGAAALAGGAMVQLGFTVKGKTPATSPDAPNADPAFEEDVALIAAGKASNQTVGMYLDITLKQIVSGVGTSSTTTSITTLPDGTVQVVIPLPKALQGKAGYTVYRVHEGTDASGSTQQQLHTITTQSVDGEYLTLNRDKTILTMYLKQFSTYAIATVNAPAGGSGSGSVTVTPTEAPTSPATGDATPAILWAMLPLMLGACGLGNAAWRKRKQR